VPLIFHSDLHLFKNELVGIEYANLTIV
jgi:hypothetical protein